MDDVAAPAVGQHVTCTDTEAFVGVLSARGILYVRARSHGRRVWRRVDLAGQIQRLPEATLREMLVKIESVLERLRA